MTKEIFQKLDLIPQVNYINKIIKEGGSLSGICKELKMGKSISSKFKDNGYKFLNKQYILTTGGKCPHEKPQEARKEEIGPITPRKVGRPPSVNRREVVKMTIDISKTTYKALKYMVIDKETTMTLYIEELLKANLNEKYFKI